MYLDVLGEDGGMIGDGGHLFPSVGRDRRLLHVKHREGTGNAGDGKYGLHPGCLTRAANTSIKIY